MKMFDQFVVIFIVLSLITGFYFFLLDSGTITIEQNFKEKYKQCEQDFDKLEQQKTPECAPVKCDLGYYRFLPGFFGVLLFIMGLITYVIGVNKMSKVKEGDGE